jgi:hypothetical protein
VRSSRWLCSFLVLPRGTSALTSASQDSWPLTCVGGLALARRAGQIGLAQEFEPGLRHGDEWAFELKTPPVLEPGSLDVLPD